MGGGGRRKVGGREGGRKGFETAQNRGNGVLSQKWIFFDWQSFFVSVLRFCFLHGLKGTQYSSQ